MLKHLIIMLAFLMALFSPVVAQDFQKGFAAYKAGDYATALQEWTPLAEAGYEVAQYNLAVMYDDGKGVLQDYKEAVKWYRLAAEQGYAGCSIQSWCHVRQWRRRSSRLCRSCEVVSTSC